MNRTLLVAAIALGCASPASASGDDLVNIFFDGNKLLRFCQSGRGDPLVFVCTGYIEGVTDLLVTGAVKPCRVLIPLDVKGDQVKDIIVQWLILHPADRHNDAAQLVTLALLEAFPCR
jgi:Rap1a immunity proteins